MLRLKDILAQDKIPSEAFEEFASKRYDGAKKIADNAKKKGGPAMLTYHHFVVKLPYYEKAKNGEFNLIEAKIEVKQLLNKLCILSGEVKMEQVEFQKLVGKIEVLGELIIKSK